MFLFSQTAPGVRRLWERVSLALRYRVTTRKGVVIAKPRGWYVAFLACQKRWPSDGSLGARVRVDDRPAGPHPAHEEADAWPSPVLSVIDGGGSSAKVAELNARIARGEITTLGEAGSAIAELGLARPRRRVHGEAGAAPCPGCRASLLPAAAGGVRCPSCGFTCPF